MLMVIDDEHNQTSWFSRECAVCGSKAIGINFGAHTCAPCKAFFRRNARRKDIMDSSCQHRDIDVLAMNDDYHDKTIHQLQIRRCSSCRLRRCFATGMKEELIRTDEENIRHKQLVDINRQTRELLRQKQLSIPQCVAHKSQSLHESDWRHLSNVVSAYDTYCIKTYVQQRAMMSMYGTIINPDACIPIKHYTALPVSLTVSLAAFLRSLPAFNTLSDRHRTYLCKNNLRSLLFLNMVELKQACFSEPWQMNLDKTSWELVCGSQLFGQFVQTEKLAETSLTADPIITRLGLISLFFSSSLFCLHDSDASVKFPKKIENVTAIQNAYVALLWNYLLYRYGNVAAIRIYSNLIHVYLKMQRVGFEIGVQVRTRTELLSTYETLNHVLSVDNRYN